MPPANTNAVNLRGIAPLLLVYDMPASIRFYRDILGFEIKQTAETPEIADRYTWVLLNLNGIELMMEPKFPEKFRPSSYPAQDKDMILYFGCPDVDKAYSNLQAKGIEIKEPVITGYGFKALYVRDLMVFYLYFIGRKINDLTPKYLAGYNR